MSFIIQFLLNYSMGNSLACILLFLINQFSDLFCISGFVNFQFEDEIYLAVPVPQSCFLCTLVTS